MKFYDWFKEGSDKELQEAVNNNMDKGLNERKLKIIPAYGIYLQKKLNDKTTNLVFATWVLALATWALAIATIIFALIN